MTPLRVSHRIRYERPDSPPLSVRSFDRVLVRVRGQRSSTTTSPRTLSISSSTRRRRRRELSSVRLGDIILISRYRLTDRVPAVISSPGAWVIVACVREPVPAREDTPISEDDLLTLDAATISRLLMCDLRSLLPLSTTAAHGKFRLSVSQSVSQSIDRSASNQHIWLGRL